MKSTSLQHWFYVPHILNGIEQLDSFIIFDIDQMIIVILPIASFLSNADHFVLELRFKPDVDFAHTGELLSLLKKNIRKLVIYEFCRLAFCNKLNNLI